MKKIVIAIDSFKGSVSSAEACAAAAKAVKDVFPCCEVIEIPVADGGEGFAEVAAANLKIMPVTVLVHNPLMRPVHAMYYYDENNRTAIMDAAQASGLCLLSDEEKNPMHTSSYGTGELIKDAAFRGAEKIIIGLGGSATNDGGTGMLRALGYHFTDKDRNELQGCGADLEKISGVCDTDVPEVIKNMTFIVGNDVDNLFYGAEGATMMFATQKGANSVQLNHLELGMKNFANIIRSSGYRPIDDIQGAGAAGGIGGAIYSFFKTQFISGAEIIFKLSDFYKKVIDADLIITGEGCIDKQTGHGKIPFKILQYGQSQNIPVLAIAGSIKDYEDVEKYGYISTVSIINNISEKSVLLDKYNTQNNIEFTLKEILNIFKYYKRL